MRFTNRYRLRRAVHLAGGGVHQSGAPRASHRLEDVERAADVGIDKGLGSLIAMWNRDQRRQWKTTSMSRTPFSTNWASRMSPNRHSQAPRTSGHNATHPPKDP